MTLGVCMQWLTINRINIKSAVKASQSTELRIMGSHKWVWGCTLVFFSFFGFDYWKKCILINWMGSAFRLKMQNFISKIRKYEGLWKFCSDGQERMEWFRKSFSKILYKYNRLSIFNAELFLVKLKLCSNNMSE